MSTIARTRRAGRVSPSPPIGSARSTVLAAGLGYLLGTFPSADIAAKLASRGTIDIRAAGTGNPGAANATAVLGKRWGYGVMVADIAKGAIASGVGGVCAGDVGRHVGATAAVAGHCYPIWSGGRGGKGVATSVGQCAATFPAYFPADLAVGMAVAAKSKSPQRSFQATAAATAVWVAAGVVWHRKSLPNLWGPAATKALPVANAVSGAVILSRFWADRHKVEAAMSDSTDAASPQTPPVNVDRDR